MNLVLFISVIFSTAQTIAENKPYTILNIDHKIISNVIADNHKCYYFTEKGSLIEHNIEGKNRSYHNRHFKGNTYSHARISHDDANIYLTTGAHFVHVVRKQDFAIDRFITFDNPVIYAPIILQDHLVVIDIYDNVYLVHKNTEQTERIYINTDMSDTVSLNNNHSLFAVNENRFVIVTASGSIMLYDTQAQDFVWRNDDYYNTYMLPVDGLMGGYEFKYGFIYNNKLFLQNKNMNIFLVDLNTGKIDQSINVAKKAIFAHASLDKSLFLLTDDFTCLQIKSNLDVTSYKMLTDEDADEMFGRRSSLLQNRVSTFISTPYASASVLVGDILPYNNNIHVFSVAGHHCIFDLEKREIFALYHTDLFNYQEICIINNKIFVLK